jgi:hypothetical protein
MRKSKKDRGKNQILLIPGPEEVENQRRRLPCFPPHDLNGLLSEAESQGLSGKERDDAVILRMRKINLEQIAQLGRALGVDPAAPDFWRRGFLALAGLHHGIGHISVRPKKTNRNSATWTTDHDLLLIREMCALRSQGLSDRKAIEQLSKDKKS